MYLDRTYKPRRRRRNRFPLWPFILLAVIGIVLYEQQPQWLNPAAYQPTPQPTRAAVSVLAEAEEMLQAGDIDGALENYARVAELEPQNPEPLVVQSDLQLARRDLDAAQTLAQQAVNVAPENDAALTALARALDWQGEYDAALNYGLDALEIDPQNATALAVIGEIYTDVGDTVRASSYISQALALEPDNVTALRNRAFLAEREGEYERAIQLYDEAIEVAPHRFDLYMEKARQYSNGLGDQAAANVILEQAVDVYESPLTLDALGYGLFEDGDSLTAVRTLEKAKDLNPEYGPVRVHLGMAYYSRLNFESAIEDLRDGVRLMGEDARIEHFFYLGLAYYYSEPRECDLAVPVLNNVLEIEPTNSIAQSAIANCGAQPAAES